jgi:hypothetical protein
LFVDEILFALTEELTEKSTFGGVVMMGIRIFILMSIISGLRVENLEYLGPS